MGNLFFTGYCKDERQKGINDIQNVVSKYGDIIDFKIFSDISLSMVIETKEFKIDELYDDLRKKLGMNKFEYMNSTSQNERTIYLNITFA
jgi:hypothetical protein